MVQNEQVRTAAGVPIAVRPGIAASVVVLTWALLWLQWFHRDLWLAASSFLHVSPWAATGLATLALTLAVVLPTTRFSLFTYGLAPRQLAQALAWGIAVWLLYQAGVALGQLWFGPAEPYRLDPFGDLVGTYSEELVYRVLALGAAAALFAGHRRPHLDAIFASTLLFILAHLPRALVTGAIYDPTYFPVIGVYGALLAAVYLATGNVLLAAILHAMADGPILLVTCPHQLELTAAINWFVCATIVFWYSRNIPRTPSAAPVQPDARRNTSPVST